LNDHLRASIPVLIKGLATQWPAYEKWQTDEYLDDKAGYETVEVEGISR
jgi:hypothetical protein